MTYEEVDVTAWIRRYRPSDASAGQLVCFPHAGGPAGYCQPLSERFSPAIDVIALQYPSRRLAALYQRIFPDQGFPGWPFYLSFSIPAAVAEIARDLEQLTKRTGPRKLPVISFLRCGEISREPGPRLAGHGGTRSFPGELRETDAAPGPHYN
jgi:hypothetical protein